MQTLGHHATSRNPTHREQKTHPIVMAAKAAIYDECLWRKAFKLTRSTDGSMRRGR